MAAPLLSASNIGASVNPAHSASAAALPSSALLPTGPAICAEKRLQCADYPLDALNQRLAAWLENDGWLRPGIQLPDLPKINQNSFILLRSLLFMPRIVQLKLPDKTLEASITLNEIFAVLKAKGQLSGGYLRYLLSSAWYREALALLLGGGGAQNVVQGDLEWIDQLPLDIDFRHMLEPGTSLEKLAESVVELVASKIPKQSHSLSFEELCVLIKQKDGAFEDYDRLFSIEGGRVQTDAFLIGLRGVGGPAIDLLLASKLEHSALTTVQDLWMDLDDPIICKGREQEGWQSAIDTSCKVLHLKSQTSKAFTAALSAMVKQFRCPEPLAPKLFENLREYCRKSKFPHARTLAKLLKNELLKHHQQPHNAGIPLTYMASAHLLRNGFSCEDTVQLWQCMSQPLHAYDALVLGHADATGPLSRIHAAAVRLPFELVDALVQIQQFTRLNRQRDRHDLKEGIFLRINESQYTMMALFGGSALTLPCKPSSALDVILWYLFQSPVLPDAQNRDLVLNLVESLSLGCGYVFDESSPVKAELDNLALNVPKILQQAHQLLAFREPELKKMGYQIAIDCHGLMPSAQTLETLLSHLPEILSIEADKDRRAHLLAFLDLQIQSRGNKTIAHPASSRGLLQSLRENQPGQEDIHSQCIKCLVESGDPLLCAAAYRILIRKSRVLPPEKKAKSILRFALLLLDKSPKNALHIINKNFEGCDFGSPDLLLFFKKTVAADISSFSREERAQLTLLIKKTIQKDPEVKSALAQLFLHKCRILLDANPNAGYALMSSIAQETRLFASCSELPDLWINYCEAFFCRHGADPESIMQMWKEAEALKLWNSPKVFYAHRMFLKDFATRLYSLNQLDADLLAHGLVNLLEKHPYKDEHSATVQQLAAVRSTKRMGESKTREELEQNVKMLIALLAAGIEETQIGQTQDAARNLIEKLCLSHPDRTVCLGHLARAQSLIENPFLQKLFERHPADLQRLVIVCLTSYYTQIKHAEEHTKVCRLLGLLLRVTFDQMDQSTHLPAILIFQRFIEIPDLDLRGSLWNPLERYLRPIIATMDLHDMHPEILGLLVKLQQDLRILDPSLDKIKGNLLRAIKSELGFFAEPVKASDALSDSSSSHGEARQPGALHKERLQANGRYRSLFQCLPLVLHKPLLDCNNPKQCLTFCVGIVESLNHLEAYADSWAWAQKVMELQRQYPQEAPENLRFVLLDAALAMMNAGNYQESLVLFKAMYRLYAELHPDIWYALTRMPDGVVCHSSRSYAKLFLNTMPKELNPLFKDRCSATIQTLLNRVVRGDSSPKELEIAMKFHEAWPGVMRFPLKPLLARVLAGKDVNLKRRAYSQVQKRLNDCMDSLHTPADKAASEEWNDNWIMGLRLCKDLWSTTHDAGYKQALAKVFEDLLNFDSTLVKFLQRIAASETQETSLEFLMPMFNDLFDDPKDQDKTYQALLGIRALTSLTPNIKLRTSVHENVISRLAKSNTPDEYSHACVSMGEIVKLHKQELSGRPAAQFQTLLRHVPLALGPQYYQIQLVLADILKAFEQAKLTDEEVLKIAEALQRHQYDLAGAMKWIHQAKNHPQLAQDLKHRQQALHVRESPRSTLLKFARFLTALGACGYMYSKVSTRSVTYADFLGILLLIYLYRYGFFAQKTAEKRT